MKKITNIIVAAVLFFSSSNLFAQGGPDPPPDSTAGPIDNFALALLIVVAVYGYMRIRKQDKVVS